MLFKTLELLSLRSKGLHLLLFQSLHWRSLTHSLNWWIQVIDLQISSALDSNLQRDIEVCGLEVHVVADHY